METPAYRGVTASAIPVLKGDDGSVIKVIAGTHEGATGPVHNTAVNPAYLDVALRPGAEFTHAVKSGDTVFAQVLQGGGSFDAAGDDFHEGETAVYGAGDVVNIRAGPSGLRFILVSGTPLREPVAWHGPIVMNTHDEIVEAVTDLRRGTFIRSKKPIIETPG